MPKKTRSAESKRKVHSEYQKKNRHRWEFMFKGRSCDYPRTLEEIAGVLNDEMEKAVVKDLIDRHGDKFSKEDIQQVVSELRQERAGGFYSRVTVMWTIKMALNKIYSQPGSLRLLRQIISTRNELEKMRDERQFQRALSVH